MKKTFSFIFSLALLITFTSTTLIPLEASAATAKTTKTTAKKKTTKKTVKKEVVDLNPPLITLETAPHSPKPAPKKAKKKISAKKVVVKKKK